MLAARLRHRVNIQALTVDQDTETGAQIEAWTDISTNTPAEVWPMSGREFIAAQSIQAGISTKITIRYQEGIEPTMRVVHEGLNYNIKAVLPDPTLRRHILLMCESGVSDSGV